MYLARASQSLRSSAGRLNKGGLRSMASVPAAAGRFPSSSPSAFLQASAPAFTPRAAEQKFMPHRVFSSSSSVAAAAAEGYEAKDILTPSKAFVGKPAPFFAGDAVMPDQSFQKISLADYKGKWLVLFSYPLDWTFVCPTEIVDYSDRYEDFKKLNCEVVAFSVDSVFSHLAWIQTPRKNGGVGDLKIPLLADGTHQISRDYGVLTESGPNLRGLFLIDPNGTLRHVTMNDPPVGRNPDETLRLLQAFQFVEEHGEVCPSSWTPGAPSMKADPKGSKEYFEKVNE